jgi:DNA-binding CsgD family transcriptional regulator
LPALLIAVYFFSYCIAFAGVGILIFMKGQSRFLDLRYYLPFVLSLLVYVFHKNSAFFISVFLHRSAYMSGHSYLLLDCLVSASLIFSYQFFYLNLGRNPRSRRMPFFVWILAFLPFVLMITRLSLEKGFGLNPGTGKTILIANSIAFILVFVISAGFLSTWRKKVAPAKPDEIFRFFSIANLVFLPLLALQAVYNHAISGPWVPLCVENLYLAGLNIMNICVLAKCALSTRNRKCEAKNKMLSLNAHELEIIRHISRGLTNKAIAYQLGVTEHVVKNGIHSILKKTNTRNRVELLRSLESAGCLIPEEPDLFTYPESLCSS